MAALLEKGSPAPEFTAPDYRGNFVSLRELRKEGPVILSFLRSFS